MAAQDSFNERLLRRWLRAAEVQPAILEAMDRPAERAKLWYEYRPIFVNEKRIAEGVDFWAAHRAALDRASLASGVPPEILVAILGVETSYGRLTGRYRVLDALATLAFDYPPRAKFFQTELEQFFLLSREAAIDPLTATGSYAGAMGAPQFMPSNYRRYAVDADRDGRVDLWTNWSDVFASIGNYFKEHGWNPGEPILSEATIDSDSPLVGANPGAANPGAANPGAANPGAANPGAASTAPAGRTLNLADTVGTLRAQGVRFDSDLPITAPALLIAADGPDGVHWRVGYENFYVITRYNHSALYAMAVYDLAAALKVRMAP